MTRLLLVALLCALLTARAHSRPTEAWGPGTENFDGWPPERFTQGGRAAVEFVDPARMGAACDIKDPEHTLEACSTATEIILPNPCAYPQDDNFARLTCHEMAHFIGGWPSNHPR